MLDAIILQEKAERITLFFLRAQMSTYPKAVHTRAYSLHHFKGPSDVQWYGYGHIKQTNKSWCGRAMYHPVLRILH